MTLFSLLISFLSLSFAKLVQGKLCTICEGSNDIPNPRGMIGEKSCRDVSMDIIFYREKSVTCQEIRADAKYICGCEISKAPTFAPTEINLQSSSKLCHVCPKGDQLLDDYLNHKAADNSTCLEIAFEATFFEENSNDCLNFFQPLGVSKCGCSNDGNSSSSASIFSERTYDGSIITPSNSNTIALAIIGCSVFILLAGFISMLLIRNKRRKASSLSKVNSNSDEENPETISKFAKNKSNLSYIGLEEGNEYVSNSTLLESKDVFSVGSTVISKSPSFNSAGKGEDNHDDTVNESVRETFSIFRMDEYSEITIIHQDANNYNNEQSTSMVHVGDFSETVPYDEAFEY